VAVLLFLAGCVAFAAGYARAVRRSREDLIGVAELFFLGAGVAPPEVRRLMLGAMGVQLAVALGTAIARPYSSLVAGTLVPVYGLGMCGLWASRHGTFPPRPEPEERGPRRSAAKPAKPSGPTKPTGRTTAPGSARRPPRKKRSN
jgi:hypothetical protein